MNAPQTVAQIIQTIERMPDHDKINHALGIEVKRKRVNLLCKASNDQPWIAVEINDATGKGPDVTVHLNRHLLIKALGFGLLRLDMIDSLSPLRLSNEGRQMIVMPTRPEGPPQTSVTAPSAPTKDAPAPVSQDTQQPAASTPAAQPERNTMPRTNGTNGNGHEPAASKPALETAVEQVEAVKASIKSAVGGLNELLDTLKQVQREQKSTDKDVQSVRITLEKLQSVKL